jgi:ubiquinone/menaquinone biosynthesis C-methylase UbiE
MKPRRVKARFFSYQGPGSVLPDTLFNSEYNKYFKSYSTELAQLPMELSDAIKLIEKGVRQSAEPQSWADLGAGDGLFSAALSTLVASKSKIYAVDSNRSILSKIKLESADVELTTINENFTSPELKLSNLDGIILANSLHFVPNKLPVLQRLKTKLRPDGRMIILEYEMKVANGWVPYPITMIDLNSLLLKAGFASVKKIGEKPSVYNASMMYCCAAVS